MKDRIFSLLKENDGIVFYDYTLKRFVNSQIDDKCKPFISLEDLETAFKMYEEELKYSVPKVLIRTDTNDVKIIYPISDKLKSYLKANIVGEKLMLEQDVDNKVVHQHLISAYTAMLSMIEEDEKELKEL